MSDVLDHCGQCQTDSIEGGKHLCLLGNSGHTLLAYGYVVFLLLVSLLVPGRPVAGPFCFPCGASSSL